MALLRSNPDDLLRPREAERALVPLARLRRLLRPVAVQSAGGRPPFRLRELGDWPGSLWPHSAHLVALRLGVWPQPQPQLVGWRLRRPVLPDVRRRRQSSLDVCRPLCQTPQSDRQLSAVRDPLLRPPGPPQPVVLVRRHRLSPVPFEFDSAATAVEERRSARAPTWR